MFYVLIHMNSDLFHFTYFLVKNAFNIQFPTYLTLAMADTRGSHCYRHTRKEWPNTCTHTYKDSNTGNQKKHLPKKEGTKQTKTKTWKGRGGKKKRKRGGEKRGDKMGINWTELNWWKAEECGYQGGKELIPIMLDRHEYFQSFITGKQDKQHKKRQSLSEAK